MTDLNVYWAVCTRFKDTQNCLTWILKVCNIVNISVKAKRESGQSTDDCGLFTTELFENRGRNYNNRKLNQE